MTDHIKEADDTLLTLWKTLEKKGFRPITYQFAQIINQGDVLTNIRSDLRNYLRNSNNFNADGSLKDEDNIFSQHLSINQPEKKEVGATDCISFTIGYRPEKGLHLRNFYIFRIYKTYELTMIDIEHRPLEPPSVNELKFLLEKTDKERIRQNMRGINKEVDFTKAKRTSVKLFK